MLSHALPPTSCQTMFFLGEVEFTLRPRAILIGLTHPFPQCSQLGMALHFFRVAPAPECEVAALSETKGDLQTDDGPSTKAGSMACSSRCCFRQRSQATWVCFLKDLQIAQCSLMWALLRQSKHCVWGLLLGIALPHEGQFVNPVKAIRGNKLLQLTLF